MHQTDDGLPMGFAHTEDEDFTIGGLVDVGRTGGAMAIAHPRVWLPFKFVGNQAAHGGKRHVEHRHFDFLSLSGVATLNECGENSAHQMAAGAHIDESGRGANAWTIVKSSDRNQS